MNDLVKSLEIPTRDLSSSWTQWTNKEEAIMTTFNTDKNLKYTWEISMKTILNKLCNVLKKIAMQQWRVDLFTSTSCRPMINVKWNLQTCKNCNKPLPKTLFEILTDGGPRSLLDILYILEEFQLKMGLLRKIIK